MGTGPRIGSTNVFNRPSRNKFFSAVQGDSPHDILPFSAAPGVGRTSASGDCLLEGGDHNTLQRVWSVGADGSLGDFVPVGGVPFLLD